MARDCVLPRERDRERECSKYTARNLVKQLSSHTKMPQDMPTRVETLRAQSIYELRCAALPWQRLHCDCILHTYICDKVSLSDHCAKCLPPPLPPQTQRQKFPSISLSFALACCQEIHFSRVGFNPSSSNLVFPKGAPYPSPHSSSCELEFNEIASFSSFVFIYLIPCWFEHSSKWNFRQGTEVKSFLAQWIVDFS